LFTEADIKVPPDCSVHEHYQGKRFWKIKASSQQSCGTNNWTKRLTSGIHGPDHRILHRVMRARLRERKNKSARHTDIMAPQPEKVDQSTKPDAKSKNRHLPRPERPSTTIFPNLWQ
jgi:hypothetical protein